MGSPPAGLLIEALLMPLNAVPAREVWAIVRTERLDHMRGFAITTLAPMNFVYQIWHLSPEILPQVGRIQRQCYWLSIFSLLF
jgi:hypothetical protein